MNFGNRYNNYNNWKEKCSKMMAWNRERTTLQPHIAPSERVVCGNRKVLDSTAATRSEGVIFLCRPRQPLMRKQRLQHAGIMGQRPRPHICGLSSFIPAMALKLQTHRDASLRSPGQFRVGIASRVIGPGPSPQVGVDAIRDAGYLLKWTVAAQNRNASRGGKGIAAQNKEGN
jgi:hypothetical protein